MVHFPLISEVIVIVVIPALDLRHSQPDPFVPFFIEYMLILFSLPLLSLVVNLGLFVGIINEVGVAKSHDCWRCRGLPVVTRRVTPEVMYLGLGSLL